MGNADVDTKDPKVTVLSDWKRKDRYPNAHGSIVFMVGGLERLRLDPNGGVFVNGRLVVNDSEIVEGMRAMIMDLRTQYIT